MRRKMMRVVAMLLAAVMLVTGLPMEAFARETDPVGMTENVALKETEETSDEIPENKKEDENENPHQSVNEERDDGNQTEDEGQDDVSQTEDDEKDNNAADESTEEEKKDDASSEQAPTQVNDDKEQTQNEESNETAEDEPADKSDTVTQTEEENTVESANAQEEEEKKRRASYGMDHCGDQLVWKWEEDVLVISGTGEMWDYREDEKAPWTDRNGSYTLYFEEGITHIGAYAFKDCTGMTGDLLLPEGLISVGEGAFSGCTNVSGRFYIPASVTTIGEASFPAEVFHEIHGFEGTYAETYAGQQGITFIPKYEICDEEELNNLENQIAQLDEEFLDADNMNTDDFKDRYGLTYEDLLLRCPEYLENETMDNYLERKFDYGNEIWGEALVDEKTAKLMHRLKEGLGYDINYLLGEVGITNTEYEKFQIEMAKSVLKDYLNTDVSTSTMLKEIADNLKKINKKYDITKDHDEFVEDMCGIFTDKQPDQLNNMVTAIKEAEPLRKYLGDAETLLKIMVSIIAMDEINHYAIEYLLESQEINKNNNELYDGLLLLQEQYEYDHTAYVLANYCKDKIIDAIAEMVVNTALTTLFGPGGQALALVGVLAKCTADIYEFINPSYEDIQYAAICHYYYISATSCVKSWQRKMKNYTSLRYTMLYEAAYRLRVSCLRVFLENAQSCTNDKYKIRTLKTYVESLNGYDVYEAYINLCMKQASEALKNGTLEIKDGVVVRKTPDGKVIDKDYDSKPSIAARFAAIQAQYVPNVGQTWKGNCEGAIQCFGFARMVFSKLYSCKMPYSYLRSARYSYTNELNVVLTGRVLGSEVTTANVKKLFQQGCLGDIVQGYGTPYGQHTSILAGVTDSGVTLYYCNENGECGIYQKSYTWAQLVARYGTGDEVSNCGISLYHASNYESIYGDGSDLFYDDSVNFVIEEGVLKKYNGWQRIVKIPDTVTAIGMEAFKNNTTMISVEIPSTVISIGDSAFYGCTSLLGVIIPDSVQSVGSDCFRECTSLTTVQLSTNMIRVNKYTFYKCTSMKKIDIPNGITTIGDYSFGNCSSLKEVMLPDSLITIEGDVFFGTVIEKIVIPDNVTNIGIAAFGECRKLVDVKLPKHIKTLGGNTFINCVSLKKIVIPKSLESASASWTGNVKNGGSGEFRGCSSLKEVSFEEGTTIVAPKLFLNAPALESIVIPEGVTKIGGDAFCGCSSLKEVMLPDSLITIEGDVFFGTVIEKIVIPDNVTNIGIAAFGECRKLADFRLPKHIKTLGGNTFINCISLKKIVIPKSLESASASWTGNVKNGGSGEFRGCTALTEVVLEDGREYIPDNLFYCAPAIQEITIPKSVTKIGNAAFYYCSSLNKVNFDNSDNIVEIASNAFQGTALTEVEIPKNTHCFGNYVFANCPNLESVHLPKTWTKLMQGSFYNCKKLKTVLFSEGLQEIRQEAFSGCEKLQIDEFPETLSSIGNSAFYNCDALTDVVLPSSVTTIEDKAFYDCDGLLSVTVPDSVTSMGANVFNHCDNLKEIALGTGITVIPQYAFANCGKIEEITLPYRTVKIDQYAFNADPKLAKITIPRNVTSIATNAFSYPDKMTIYGITGTYAETFAKANGYPFVNQEIAATEISVTPEELIVNRRQSKRLVLKVTPSNFTDKVTFKSADTNIATVDEDGMVTGITTGNTTVKVIVGNLSKNIKVQINEPVSRISVSPYSQQLEAGDELELTVEVYPNNATNKSYEFSSSDSTIASVTQEGIVKALKKGNADITVTALDGSGSYATCRLTVTGNLYQVLSEEGFESSHPYEDNCSDVWEYQNPGAKKIELTFSEDTELEDGFDSIQIFGAQKKLVGTYTGKELAGKSVEVEGSVVRVKLISDDAGNAYGFKVTDVRIDGEELPLRSIQLDKPELNLSVGQKQMLHVIYNPADTIADKTVTWLSSDEEVAAVDSEGMISAKKNGTAVITATSVYNSALTATCNVTVTTFCVAFDSRGGSSIESVECNVGDVLELSDKIPVRDGYLFTGWYKDEQCSEPWNDTDVVESNMTLYAGWVEAKEGFYVLPIRDYDYTGAAIRPEIVAYDGTTKLTWKKDYTVTYKNNINVYSGNDDTRKPQIIVKGIGNYRGTQTITFNIRPKNLGDEDISIDDIYVAANSGKKNTQPTVMWGRKKLVYNSVTDKSQYTLTYPDIDYTRAGEYQVKVNGRGNYCGENSFLLVVTDMTMLTKAKISYKKAMPYRDGYPVVQEGVVVKLGGKRLEKDTDYTISYEDNTQVGTATMIVKGIGKYSGMKKVTYSITGVKLSKAKIIGIRNMEYTGSPIYQQFVVRCNGNTLIQGRDYKVSYEKNIAAGKATLILKGIGRYTGTLKKTFQITPYSMKQDKLGYLKDCSEEISVSYEKSGAKPSVSLTFRGKVLVEGRDYTLSYKNNKAVSVGSNSNKKPTIVINGKGNFKDSINREFKISKADIGANGYRMQALDVVFKNKAGAYKTTPVIYDTKGKKLTAGIDYDKKLIYRMNNANGKSISDSEVLPVKSIVYVEAKGINNYDGSTIGTTYRIVTKSIKSARVEVKTKSYTGYPVTITKDDIISIKVGNDYLTKDDYEILPDTYINNVKKGKAKVTIRGLDDYGGEKQIVFKIVEKSIEK